MAKHTGTVHLGVACDWQAAFPKARIFVSWNNYQPEWLNLLNNHDRQCLGIFRRPTPQFELPGPSPPTVPELRIQHMLVFKSTCP